jgi:flagellar biosynthesis/type III secretory pathway ATPase
VLSRQLGAAGHYPAIDVLSSISRVASHVAKPEQLKAAGKLREALSCYHNSEDLLQLGAYVSGSNSKLDASIRARERILNFLRQGADERAELSETLSSLTEIAAVL